MSDTNLARPASAGAPPQLERRLSLFSAIAMGAGLVIGVGLYTVSTNAVGYLGPMLVVGNLFALVVALLTSLCYAELAAASPFAGGSYVYAFQAWGKKYGPFAGFVSAWLVIQAYFFVGAEALAFANYLLSTLDFYGFWKVMVDGQAPEAIAALIAAALVLVFTFVNWFGVKEASKTQNVVMVIMYVLVISSIVWMVAAYGDSKNVKPFVPVGLGAGEFWTAVTLIWWAYAGQEVIGAMGEEIEHPSVNIPRALIAVPFVVFLVTCGIQWSLLTALPDFTILKDAGAPFALGLQTAGVGGLLFGMFMLAEFMGNFSTVNPVLTGTSRTC